MKATKKIIGLRSTQEFHHLLKVEAAKRNVTIDQLLNAAVMSYINQAA